MSKTEKQLQIQTNKQISQTENEKQRNREICKYLNRSISENRPGIGEGEQDCFSLNSFISVMLITTKAYRPEHSSPREMAVHANAEVLSCV